MVRFSFNGRLNHAARDLQRPHANADTSISRRGEVTTILFGGLPHSTRVLQLIIARCNLVQKLNEKLYLHAHAFHTGQGHISGDFDARCRKREVASVFLMGVFDVDI